MNASIRWLPMLLLTWTCLLPAGCTLGPRALRASRTDYNEVVRLTTAEQLLLNLVRLYYRQEPLFLDVGHIAAQFTFEGSGEIGGRGFRNYRYEEPTPDYWNWGVGLGYREQPTITFSPLQGEEFVQRLLAPTRLETLVLLVRSGWRIDRVLRVSAQCLNDLDNASNAASPTPDLAPEFEAFLEVTRAFRELQKQGLLELGHEMREEPVGPPLPGSTVSATDQLAAAREGLCFKPTADGSACVLTRTRPVLVWRIPPEAMDSPSVARIIDGLGLAPGRTRYELVEMPGQFRPTAPPGERTRIEIATRSLLGTLFYLSQGIEVPPSHRARGLVTTTRNPDGTPFDWRRVTGDLLRVRSQALPPAAPAVAVWYRGYWFYIDDADLQSKSTFALLGQLFALQAGLKTAGGPLLTLPVGG